MLTLLDPVQAERVAALRLQVGVLAVVDVARVVGVVGRRGRSLEQPLGDNPVVAAQRVLGDEEVAHGKGEVAVADRVALAGDGGLGLGQRLPGCRSGCA